MNIFDFIFSSLSLACELTFFVNILSSDHPLSSVKSLLSSTLIVNYLSSYLFSILSSSDSIFLVNQICLTLYSIFEIPSFSSIDVWPYVLLKYLYKERSCSLSIIEYLILIIHNSIQRNSSEMFSLLNEYFNEIGIHQENFDVICQLLILICSFNYSHELFQREIIKKIENYLKTSKDSELRKDKNKYFLFY